MSQNSKDNSSSTGSSRDSSRSSIIYNSSSTDVSNAQTLCSTAAVAADASGSQSQLSSSSSSYRFWNIAIPTLLVCACVGNMFRLNGWKHIKIKFPFSSKDPVPVKNPVHEPAPVDFDSKVAIEEIMRKTEKLDKLKKEIFKDRKI